MLLRIHKNTILEEENIFLSPSQTQISLGLFVAGAVTSKNSASQCTKRCHLERKFSRRRTVLSWPPSFPHPFPSAPMAGRSLH